ncbi:MAG: hypothetical protein HRU15_12530 [Planctomycetes bacterium]|nr:hypothetical protein [Planctomycetota bacterium]
MITQKIMMTAVIILLCPLVSAAEQKLADEDVQYKKLAEQHFLVFRSELKDLMQIAGMAHKHIPQLFAVAKKEGMEIDGHLHHFYFNKNGVSYLEIGLPLKKAVEYTGEHAGKYKIVKKESGLGAAYMHRGTVAKIGQSWELLHQYSFDKGLQRVEGREVYLTKDVMSKDTKIELIAYYKDPATLKGECFITGFVADSQAQTQGAQVDDIITHYAEVKISNFNELVKAIRKHAESQEPITLRLQRAGKPTEIQVQPGSLGAKIGSR